MAEDTPTGGEGQQQPATPSAMETPPENPSGGGETPPTKAPPPGHKAWWSANIRLVFVLLIIWFAVSLGCSVLLVDTLNQYKLFGFKMGFWMAQQGSMVVFVLLILFYAVMTEKLDRQHGVSEEDEG